MDRRLWRLVIFGAVTIASLFWFAIGSSDSESDSAQSEEMISRAKQMGLDTTDAVREADEQAKSPAH
ncbi:MAG: hypothetical protein ABL962_01800 [Fimbriimonadaceae bacterium]